VAAGIGIAIAVLGFGALMFAQIIDDAVGCGSIDPTDAANYSVVTIVNDTEHAVTLGYCQGAYCTIEGPKFLQPGEGTRAEAPVPQAEPT
jgi:hypothetical protein